MKKILALAAICLFALGLIVVPGQAVAKDKVRVLFPTTSYAVWYNEISLGLPKSQGGLGFFEEEGLDVEISGAPGSTAATKLVGAGKADVSFVGYGPMVIAIDKGMPVISPWIVTRRNIFYIVVPEEGPIKTVKDLKGKRIGVYSYGSDGVPMAKAMAQEAGLDPEKDIELVPIGLGAQAVNAIKTGKVVGGSYWDTGIALMEVQGITFRYLSTPGVDGTYSSGYVMNTNWLKNNRDAAVRWLRAIAKAAVFIQTNPAASIKVHWKLFPASKKLGKQEDEEGQLKDMTHVLKARLRTVKQLSDTSVKIGWMDKKVWENTIDFYVKTGKIAKRIPAEKVFTNDMIDEANNFDMQRIIDMAKNYK